MHLSFPSCLCLFLSLWLLSPVFACVFCLHTPPLTSCLSNSSAFVCLYGIQLCLSSCLLSSHMLNSQLVFQLFQLCTFYFIYFVYFHLESPISYLDWKPFLGLCFGLAISRVLFVIYFCKRSINWLPVAHPVSPDCVSWTWLLSSLLHLWH